MNGHLSPADAYRLLSDRKLISFACDVTRNEAFWKANAKTEDAHGERVIDYVRTPAQREIWPKRIAALLALPPAEFEHAMTAEKVKLSPVKKADGRKRIVGVPTFTRRCISNVITMILAETGEHLLPSSARAYRPGSKEAVKNALLDVARAVRLGRVRFWAKLDFRSYFSEMPWWAVEAALKHYGYKQEFIEVVMAVVRCPLVRRKDGKTFAVPNDRGAQMGLAESATLANMVPFELDAWFAARTKSLIYVRYSDDVFIGGAKKSDVIGAVRAVQRWCRAHQVALKGGSPDMRAERLVEDVKNARIDLLGAEIDQNGEVRMPISKLAKKLDAIRYRYENLAPRRIVEAVSQYGDGGGTHLFDLDDVEETVDGFLSYWRDLDPRGAEKARVFIDKTFPMSRSPSSGGKGVVWIARLWGVQAGGGVEAMIPAAHEPKEPTETGPLALTGGGAGLDSAQRNMGGIEISGGSSGPEPTLEVEDAVEADVLYTEAAVDLLSQVEDEDSDEGCSSYGVGEDAFLPGADGRKTHRFRIPSRDQGGSLFHVDQEMDLRQEDLPDINGAVDDLLEEPPLPAAFENKIVLYVAAERLDGLGGPRCAVGVGRGRGGVLLGRPVVSLRAGRPESTLVQAILAVLPSVSGEMIVVIPQTRLVKALLQCHRRVRAPLMFGLITDLHTQAQQCRRRVTVIGGVEPPTELQKAIRRIVDAEMESCAA